MKKYTRHRNLRELARYCLAKGWELDSELFRVHGHDHVSIKWRIGRISGFAIVSMVNGRFFGELKSGRWFGSDDSKLDRFSWFRGLLEAVYVGEIHAP